MTTITPDSADGRILIELVELGPAPVGRIYSGSADSLITSGLATRYVGAALGGSETLVAATPAGAAVYCDMFKVKTTIEGRQKRLGGKKQSDSALANELAARTDDTARAA